MFFIFPSSSCSKIPMETRVKTMSQNIRIIFLVIYYSMNSTAILYNDNGLIIQRFCKYSTEDVSEFN